MHDILPISYYPQRLAKAMQQMMGEAAGAQGMAGLLLSLETFQRDLQECKNAREILALTERYLDALGLFQTIGFYLTTPPAWSFELKRCHPESDSVRLQRMVKETIEAGTFAWALRRPRAVLVHPRGGAEGEPLLLHSVGTRANTCGMLVAFPKSAGAASQDLPWSLVSIILAHSAYALESQRLQLEIRQHNEQLQQRVDERTRQLIQANSSLSLEVVERKKSQKTALEEKEKLSVMLRSMAEGVIATDPSGRVQLMNPPAEKLTGWPQSEAAGEMIDNIFSVSSLERSFGETGAPRVWENGVAFHSAQPVLLRSRHGEERPIAYTASPIRRPDGAILGSVFAFRDVTSQEKLAREMLKSSKLESVGILAGGIAHDFRNILTAVIGNISLALRYSEDSRAVENWLNDAVKASLRARDLTQQLLTFSKGGAPQKQTISLEGLIREATQFGLQGSATHAEFRFEEHPALVDADAGQLAQVVQNIALNAAQGMPEGGTLEVHTENITLKDDATPPLLPGCYVRISFKDHGIGIRARDLPRIFDPYFTTKQHGSGLGLATCYSIVKQHGGHITVDSEVGMGTVFQVYLPVSQNSLSCPGARAQPQEHSPGGRLLIMEDDVQLRQLLPAMLTRLGYEVVLAEEGQETIDLYQAALAEQCPFSAVVLDLTIPGGMGGKETVQKLRALDPDVKALVCSGYSNDPVLANFREYGFRGAVSKPFSVDQFAEALRRLLQS